MLEISRESFVMLLSLRRLSEEMTRDYSFCRSQDHVYHSSCSSCHVLQNILGTVRQNYAVYIIPQECIIWFFKKG